jgi:hypothetical protein
MRVGARDDVVAQRIVLSRSAGEGILSHRQGSEVSRADHPTDPNWSYRCSPPKQ